MRFTKTRATLWVAALAATILGMAPTGPAAAQDYPTKDIQYIVQAGVGGGSDILARTLAKVLQDDKLIPVKVLVENRPGGAGAVAYHFIASRKRDAHLLGGVGVSFFTTPLLGNSPVTWRDFTPLAGIARSPYILAVRADSKVATIEDIKATPGLRAGTAAAVSDPTLLAAWFGKETGAQIRVVPFDGEGEVLAALLGGHLDLIFGNPNEILEQVKAGSLRPIAVTSAERMSALLDVPTFKELGVDLVHTQLRGIIMPPGQTPETVAYWEAVLRQVAESESWRQQYVDRFNEIPAFVGSTEFATEMERTSAMYTTLMRDLGMID